MEKRIEEQKKRGAFYEDKGEHGYNWRDEFQRWLKRGKGGSVYPQTKSTDLDQKWTGRVEHNKC